MQLTFIDIPYIFTHVLLIRRISLSFIHRLYLQYETLLSSLEFTTQKSSHHNMILLVVISFILVYILYKVIINPGSLTHIPGPWPWPIIGNTLQINPKKAHFTYIEWEKKYGNIFRVQTTGKEVVVVSGKDFVHEVLVTRGKDFANRPKSYRLQQVTFDYSGIGFMDYCEKYKWMRKFLSKGLKMTYMKEVEKTIERAAQEYITDVNSYNGQPFNPLDIIGHTVYQTAMFYILGEYLNRSDPHRKLLKELVDIAIHTRAPAGLLLDVFPWLRFFGIEMEKMIQKQKQIQLKIFEVLKARVVKNGEYNDSWLSHLIKAKENNEANLTDDNVMMGAMDSTTGKYDIPMNSINYTR